VYPAEDAWEEGRQLMNNPADFIKELVRIDLGRLNNKNMIQVAALLEDEDMTPENAKSVSRASESLLRFVIDLYNQWREVNQDIDLTKIPSASTDQSQRMIRKRESAPEPKPVALEKIDNLDTSDLDVLNKSHVNELKSYKSPATLIAKVMKCVLLIHSKKKLVIGNNGWSDA
jgi:hypothetical protein